VGTLALSGAGVFTTEVALLLAACEEFGLTKGVVKTELADPSWCFPSQTHSKAKQLHRIFDPYRDSASDSSKLKCSASELLGVYDILRYIIAVRAPRVDELTPKLASFDAACTVLDVLLAAKRGSTPAAQAAEELQGRLQRHMALHIAAYGGEGIRPKHHWNLDLPMQILRDGFVLDAFVIERSHLRVKRIADTVKNTLQFERSVLAGVLNATLNRPADGWSHALMTSVCAVGDGVFAAKKMHIYGLLALHNSSCC
jgi:hypothetical protein